MEDTWLDFEKPVVELEKRISDLKGFQFSDIEVSDQIRQLEEKANRLKQEIYSNLTPWQRVQMARHPQRPYTADYIERMFDTFVELHGDRLFGDDRALICGIGFIDDIPLCLMGHQKGRGTKDNVIRNFGMAHPEGYRKALRIMKLAEKYRMPVISLIDTPGAYPGVGSEERGVAEAIARNLFEMSRLETMIIALVIGEGGSGGAIGIGLADRVLLLENSIYSVISPEACATILYREKARAREMAQALRLTAQDLLEFNIIDEIIPEPLGGAHRDLHATVSRIKERILFHIDELQKSTIEELKSKRLEKYLDIGRYDTK
jgi:acetyl-CoA carboxylase carboxyl transferase subunit alpha